MSASSIEVRLSVKPPQFILAALGQVKGKYSSICHLFHLIQIDMTRWVGVAGDAGNASYEYFVYDEDGLRISDCGYGATEWALRDVLNQEFPK